MIDLLLVTGDIFQEFKFINIIVVQVVLPLLLLLHRVLLVMVLVCILLLLNQKNTNHLEHAISHELIMPS